LPFEIDRFTSGSECWHEKDLDLPSNRRYQTRAIALILWIDTFDLDSP